MFSNAEAWLEQLEQQLEENIFVVHDDCKKAIELFLKINHLWRYAPMGGLLGIDWQQTHAYLALLKLEPTPQDIEDVRIIESAVIKEINKD